MTKPIKTASDQRPSEQEAIWLFVDDPIKNFNVLRNRHISDNVILSDITNITALPEGLTVDGSLFLENCTSLKSLPKRLKISGRLELTGCTSLTSLPEGIHVGKDINLTDCASLTELPEKLKVKWLFLTDCKSLTSLPKGLDVLHLILSGCVSLLNLPEDISVGGNIWLNECDKLKVWLVKERKIEWLKRRVKGNIYGLLEL